MYPKFQPTDQFEEKLIEFEDLEAGKHSGETYWNKTVECVFCGVNFREKRFLIDGSTQSGSWALMCALCFHHLGVKIEWGFGQLYTQMEDGTWFLTGGFSEDEEEFIE